MAATGAQSFYDHIYGLLEHVPPGRVVTFGQLAALAGAPRAARAVGYAMNNLSWESRIPWWRVLNAAGAISQRAGPGPDIQRARLEEEGVYFSFAGTVDLNTYRWWPEE